MNLKKVITWLVVAFVVFYVIQAPESSAQLVRNAGEALGDGVEVVHPPLGVGTHDAVTDGGERHLGPLLLGPGEPAGGPERAGRALLPRVAPPILLTRPLANHSGSG